jgi:hypothetical protein
VAAILAVLGLTAAVVWGAVGTITTLDRVDDFDRVAVPGAMTVFVADPGTKVVYIGFGPVGLVPADSAEVPAARGPNGPCFQAVRHLG